MGLISKFVIATMLITLVACRPSANPMAKPIDVEEDTNVTTTSTTTTTMSPQASLLGLSASADQIIEKTIDVEFSCANRKMGYYADINNDCRIFHICNPTAQPDGQLAVMQYSFFCPNGTQFQQSTLTCVTYNSAIPCEESEIYYSMNQDTNDRSVNIPAKVKQENQKKPAQSDNISPVEPKKAEEKVVRKQEQTQQQEIEKPRQPERVLTITEKPSKDNVIVIRMTRTTTTEAPPAPPAAYEDSEPIARESPMPVAEYLPPTHNVVRMG